MLFCETRLRILNLHGRTPLRLPFQSCSQSRRSGFPSLAYMKAKKIAEAHHQNWIHLQRSARELERICAVSGLRANHSCFQEGPEEPARHGPRIEWIEGALSCANVERLFSPCIYCLMKRSPCSSSASITAHSQMAEAWSTISAARRSMFRAPGWNPGAQPAGRGGWARWGSIFRRRRRVSFDFFRGRLFNYV